MGTIILTSFLAVIVVFVIVFMIKRRRSGKSSCSCGCSECPVSGSCSIKKVENPQDMR